MLTIDPEPLRILRAQRTGRGQHRAFIDVHQLDRHRSRIAQFALPRIEALAQRIRLQLQQRRHIARQVRHNQRIFIIRMPRQRHDPAGIAPRGAKHTGDVNQRLHLRNINQGHQLLLITMRKQKRIQLRLLLFDQFCHRQRRPYIRHRIVRLFVRHAVGLREMLQLKAGKALIIFRPDNPFRAQRIAGAHHIQQIPARIAVLPAPAVGIKKVAVEDVARDFVIKAHVVIADHAGIGLGKQRVDTCSKLRFRNAARARNLRRNASDHHRFRLRQIVICRLTVEHLRFTHRVKVGIGAQAGKLGRTIQRRALPEGFIIMEQKGELRGGHGVILD